MEKLRLLLLEDLDEEAIEVVEFLEDNDYEVIRVKNIAEAESVVKNRFLDIILLDIMIDGNPEGIQFAHQLNKQNINIPFIFLTSMQSKVVFDQAKLTRPYTYLLKPFNKLELLFALELAIEKYNEQDNSISIDAKNAVLSPSFLFLKKKRSIKKVQVDTIDYIEVEGKYCNIFCENDTYLIRLSLKKVNELLQNKHFVQVHRNYMVNLQKVEEIFINDNLILLKGNKKVSFSDNYKLNFMNNNNILK